MLQVAAASRHPAHSLSNLTKLSQHPRQKHLFIEYSSYQCHPKVDRTAPMATKTYLLAPSFDYPPGSAIRLGALVADPLSPHRVLGQLPPDKRPKVTTSIANDFFMTVTKAQHGKGPSAVAYMLQMFGGKILWGKIVRGKLVQDKTGGELTLDESAEYAMSSLRTEFFEADPRDDDLEALLQTPRVQAAMRHGLWARPLYLITGIKIAEGLSLSKSRTSRHGAASGLNVPLFMGLDVSASLEASVAREKWHDTSFKMEQQVVLAYQLLRIARKGWRERRLEMETYRPKAAFLGAEEDEDGDLDEELEISRVSLSDICKWADENPAAFGSDQSHHRYVMLSDE